MTQQKWENELIENLKSLPYTECIKIIEYYREIYSDKKDAGLSEEEILKEFGSPQACAKKIVEENAAIEQPQTTPKDTEKEVPKEKAKVKTNSRYTVANIIGMIFLTVLLAIPFATAAVTVLAGFAACSIGGAACVAIGVFYFFASPFSAIGGATFTSVIAYMGMSICACGVGLLLAIGFYYATKYCAIGCYKFFIFIYKGRKQK